MTDAIDLTTEQRKTLNDLLRRFLPGVAVWAYGSRVKWTARPNSDLDLVVFTTPRQRPQVAELKDALAESNLPFPVDLHVWDDVPERFREIIRKEYVVVQEAKEPSQKQGLGSEWTMVTLGYGPLEIIDGDRGENYPKQQDFDPAGHCLFLNAGNVTTSGFNFNDCAFISADKDSVLRKGRLKRHDVVLTTRGTVGNVAYFDESISYEHIRINSGMVILRAQPEKLRPRFLYLFLRSFPFRSQVESLRTGSAQPQLPIRDINRIEIPVPPPEEQDAIAHILGTLDDKIALNRKMNETLEAMARALFKSWFVDFDPVRAKAEGRDTGLPTHLADLFPDSFEDSELGEIPRGWGVKRLDEVADVNWGDTNVTKSAYTDEGFVAYSAKGPDGFLPYYDFDRVGIVVSAIGANSGFTWLAHGKWSCIKNTIRLWATAPNISTEYLFFATLGNDFWPVRGSAQPFIAQGDARAIRILYPSDGIAQQFGEFTGPLFEKIQANKVESLTLAAVRDTLLPKLISGELRVKDRIHIVLEPTT